MTFIIKCNFNTNYTDIVLSFHKSDFLIDASNFIQGNIALYISNSKKILELENLFFDLLDKQNIIHTVNGENRISGIINITFPNILGQNLVMKLDLQGVAVSFGSACSSGTPKASTVLLDLGLDDEQALRTIRISIGKFHKNEDIYDLINSLEGVEGVILSNLESATFSSGFRKLSGISLQDFKDNLSQ